MDANDSRAAVRTVGTATVDGIPKLLPSLVQQRDFKRGYALLLRGPEVWRLVTDREDLCSELYKSGQLIQTFKRTPAGLRYAFIINKKIGLFLGPGAVLDQFNWLATLPNRYGVRPSKLDNNQLQWELDLASLDCDDYFALRLPILYNGISHGKVTILAGPRGTSVSLVDALSRPVMSKEFRFMNGHIGRFEEKKWLPGGVTPYEITTCNVEEFEAKDRSDEVFCKDYFDRTNLVDERAGRDNARLIHLENGHLPTEAEFEEIYDRTVGRDRTVRDWAVVSVGAGLIVLAIVHRRRRR
jgi:hypothetical protein